MLHRDIIEKAQKGDVFAFRALINEYKEQAVRIAYSVTGNMADAQDAAQDAFLRIYKKVGTYQFESEFSTWVYRIVVNTCYDLLRKNKRDKAYVLDDKNVEASDFKIKNNSNPAKELLNKELNEKIEQALRILPERQQMVFKLRFKNGMKIKTIASMLGVSASAVKMHLFRAVSGMQKKLGAYLR